MNFLNCLLVNCCARPESRTLPLALEAAKKLCDNIEIVNLYEENVLPLDNETLKKRDAFIAQNDYSDGMFDLAKQFSQAEFIVIAAPYWDLSFPSSLKCYVERICVNGLTFYYNEIGIPKGLCCAKKLVYVTTAGGFIPDVNFGFDYIKQLCSDFFGIEDTVCIKAQGLDIEGADVNRILFDAQKTIEKLLK